MSFKGSKKIFKIQKQLDDESQSSQSEFINYYFARIRVRQQKYKQKNSIVIYVNDVSKQLR